MMRKAFKQILSLKTLLLAVVLWVELFPTQGYAEVMVAENPPQNPNQAEPANLPALQWKEKAQGLALGKGEGVLRGLTILKINPTLFRFTLYMASKNTPARPMAQWAADYSLLAAINASMYLPDLLTSTGYLRDDAHINNARMGKRLGAFFVANPKEEGLPAARILEGHGEGTLDLLEKYEIVVQNYRLVGDNGQALWAAKGKRHSIAAVAEDRAGNILFILNQNPIEPAAFANLLLSLNLDITVAMYVEGGSKALLLVKKQLEGTLKQAEMPSGNMQASTENEPENALPSAVYEIFRGISPAILEKPGEPSLPNVLGIVQRNP